MASKLVISLICIAAGITLGTGAFYLSEDEEIVVPADSKVSDFISLELKENLPFKIEDTAISASAADISSLRAGQPVKAEALDMDSIEDYFTINAISDEVLSRIKGKSYPESCPINLDDLRYIRVLHYNINEEIYTGEIIVNKAIARDIKEIFTTLFLNKYPVEKMVLVDEFDADDVLSMENNNTTGFNYRVIAGTDSISNHSFGMAVDINPLYNPYVVNKNGVQMVSPDGGRNYVNRNNAFAYKIDKNDLCYKLFTEYGFTWGGDWKNVKDYQHFEKE